MKLRLVIPFVILLTVFSSFAQTGEVKYTQMTESEKLKFIENRSNEFLGLFRTVGAYQIDKAGIVSVKRFVDDYVKRLSVRKTSSTKCSYGDDLATVLQRGKLYAPNIKAAFKSNEIPVEVGLYIAMIDSEFCPCLQSPTGPLGMFQFTRTTATVYGINAVSGASPEKPDDRCKVNLAAAGAAKWMKKMLDTDFGNNSIGIPFALTSFNSGEGVVRKLIKNTNLDNNDEFTYWMMKKKYFSLVESDQSGEIVIKQFETESSRYFPKFLAAMMIGENPKTFGINMNPLSQN